MNKLKTILLLFIVFLLTTTLAFYYENSYRILVRFFFNLFQGDKIQFAGKNFHLFASYSFVIGFGLYCILLIMSLYGQTPKGRPIYSMTCILLFLGTTMATTFADSTIKIAECTACQYGIRDLHYNAINYDFHFISSLAISLLPSLWVYIKRQQKLFRQRKLAYNSNIVRG